MDLRMRAALVLESKLDWTGTVGVVDGTKLLQVDGGIGESIAVLANPPCVGCSRNIPSIHDALS